MKTDIKAILLVVTAAASAVLYTESTYFKVADAREQFQAVREEIQESRLDGLYRDKAALEQVKAKRPLTDIEQGQYERVLKQIERVEKALNKK